MTLGRLAALASLAIVTAAFAALVVTGDLWGFVWILAAPLPLQIVHGFYADRAGRRLGDLRRPPADVGVEDRLDRALRGEPDPLPFDSGPEWFLPGCPPLPDGGASAGSSRPAGSPSAEPQR